MNRSEAIPHVSYVVDDAGCASPLGDNTHALVRELDKAAYNSQIKWSKFRYASVLVGWDDAYTNSPVFVAVHSYLDVELTDAEVTELATDYLFEIGCFRHADGSPRDSTKPNYLIR